MFEFLFSAIAFVVTLGILVTFHEWGHFFAARKLGVKVLRFSVGFGNPLWKKVGKDGTEYVVAGIPLGGYVKMLDEREVEVPDDLKDQAFNNKALWKRSVIVLAGPLANFLLAIFVYWIAFIYGEQTVRPALDVLEPTSLASQSGLKAQDVIVAVDSQPVTDWQDVVFAIAKRMGDKKPIEFTVRQAGESATHKVSIETTHWVYDERRPDIMSSLGLIPVGMSPIIGDLPDDGAAKQSGLLVGDRVTGLGGKKILQWNHITEFMSQFKGGELRIDILRGEELKTVYLTPTKSDDRFLIGIGRAPIDIQEYRDKYLVIKQYGPGEAVGKALTHTWEMVKLTGIMLKKFVTREVSAKSLGGPLSIAESASSSLRGGLVIFLGFLGMISVNLGLINLLPIPVLDGGHLLFNIMEAIKGKPLSEASQAFGMKIGLFLVLGLMAIAIFNDFARHLVG